MCGITGVICSDKSDRSRISLIEAATDSIRHRGPDAGSTFIDHQVALGHRRLSIIDTSASANQPMTDSSGRYTLVFNGEIYNFAVYRKLLEEDGVQFRSNSDTEVLLYLYIKFGKECLEKLNGFFAFCIWDNVERKAFLARDRMGIKPLYWYSDGKDFCFGSELRTLGHLNVPKEIDRASLFSYLQLNYIPFPSTIFKEVQKLAPGHYIELDLSVLNAFDEVKPMTYFEIPRTAFNNDALNPTTYAQAKKTLITLLDTSVKKRMISDVPLGSFLSGGVDSSVIATLASRHTDQLKTFSIGFRDEEFFDETEYAELVAKKINSDHHSFRLTNDDFLEHIDSYLDHIDEPFADSSGLNVFMLSRETKKHVSVALSGDGADEMFSGYNKHMAEYKVRNQGIGEKLLVSGAGALKWFPQSRDGKLANLNRQLQRFSEGASLSARDRYWRWATFRSEEKANYLLLESIVENEQRLTDSAFAYKKRREAYLKNISKTGNFNEVLYTDMQLVLPNDMLYKVDQSSMAQSLEVRTPFLDADVVEFAFQIPDAFKINGSMRKKILQDAFKDMLPQELYDRPKKGFELPLHSWLTGSMYHELDINYLNSDYLQEQGIFNEKAVRDELLKLKSQSPGDRAGTIWNLLVFQRWYKNHME